MKKAIFVFVVLIALVNRTFSQIPNNGFENWTSKGNYYIPDSWSCLNDMTASKGIYTCERGTPGNPGSYFLKLTSKNITGLGIVPGIAVCGTLDQTTLKPLKGFAFNLRPVSLTGNWQYMVFGNIQGYIDIQLTRWDAGSQTRVIVASAHSVLPDMVMNWTPFNIHLTYVDGNIPDSCIIVLSASGSVPTDGDYLFIDNLAFNGSVEGISENSHYATSYIFPNPAQGILTLDLSALNVSQVSFCIFNLEGELVKSINNLQVSSKIMLDVSDLPAGNYLLETISKVVLNKQSFIIQR